MKKKQPTGSVNTFLENKNLAIAGVSRKKEKFGNAIYKELNKRGFNVFPVNPNLDEYMGEKCYHSLAELPPEVQGVVISTKSAAALKLIEEAKQQGIKNIWLQQGSVRKDDLQQLNEPELNIVSRECILMFAGEVKGIHGFHRWMKKTFGTLPS